MTTLANRFNALSSKQSTTPSQARPKGKLASPEQRGYLIDLRERFGISLQGVATITARDAYQEIQQLQARPTPPSPEQMKIIRDTIAILNKAGLVMNISEEKLGSLTAGRDGTASKMIEFLFAKRTEVETVHLAIASLNDEDIDLEVFRTLVASHTQGDVQIDPKLVEAIYLKRHEVELDIPMITDNQVTVVSEWYFCPDIPFEEFGVSLRVPMPEVGERTWRRKTQEEFVEDIKANITRQEASRLIDRYRGVYYDWKRTRINKAQINLVRTLDQRLANVYTSTEVGYAVDMNGDIIEIPQNNARKRMPTSSHIPMTDEDLMQLSVEEGSKLIDQMNYDLKRTFESEVDNSQQALTDKFAKFEDVYKTGQAKSADDAMSKELHDLGDFIYKLEAMVGQEAPELHELVRMVFLKQEASANDLIEELQSFMKLAIDESNEDRFKETFGSLMQASEHVPLAEQALLAM